MVKGHVARDKDRGPSPIGGGDAQCCGGGTVDAAGPPVGEDGERTSSGLAELVEMPDGQAVTYKEIGAIRHHVDCVRHCRPVEEALRHSLAQEKLGSGLDL